MTVDHDKLRELALAATPGPWVTKEPMSEHSLSDVLSNLPDQGLWTVATCNRLRIEHASNANYIAAANPQTILALLDELAQCRADAEHYQRLVEYGIDREVDRARGAAT